MIRSIDGQSELSKLNTIGELRPSGSKEAKKAEQHSPTSDRVELSNEARQVLENPELLKHKRIEARMASGFYNSPHVLHTVAQRLLRDVEGGDNSGSTTTA